MPSTHPHFLEWAEIEAFETEDLVRSAVERKFEIIGEALRQASYHFPGAVDSVPDLKDAINQRNRIAHGYLDVDAQVLWNAMRGDLEQVQDEVTRLKK